MPLTPFGLYEVDCWWRIGGEAGSVSFQSGWKDVGVEIPG